jgi:lambda family phage portal protein
LGSSARAGLRFLRFGHDRRALPAEQIIHMFRPLVPGQVRGLSWFAPVLLAANELDALLDAMLVRAKVAALFVGSISDVDGSGPGFPGEQTGPILDTTIEPGAIRVEQPGKRLQWSEPPTAGDAPKVATETLRMIAAGVGITYEQLTGDYSQVNYSSARAALLEFRRFCEGIQHNVIVFQMLRPIWRRFILWEVLKGTISAAAYQADRAAFEAVKWLPPRWDWVDPQSDVQAAILEMNAGLTSRSQLVSERGYDVEALDKEIAADRARADRLGLNLTLKGPANAA